MVEPAKKQNQTPSFGKYTAAMEFPAYMQNKRLCLPLQVFEYELSRLYLFVPSLSRQNDRCLHYLLREGADPATPCKRCGDIEGLEELCSGNETVAPKLGEDCRRFFVPIIPMPS